MPEREDARARQTTSLAARLAVSAALVLLVGGGLVAAGALAYGRQAARQAYDRLLIGAADQIAGSVSAQDGRIAVDIPATAFDLLSLAPEDRMTYAVLDPEGRLITGYAGVPYPVGRFATGDFAGEPARYIRVSRAFAERDYSGTIDVIVGQTTRARDALAREITRRALLGGAVIGLLMAGLAAFAIRSALAPLRRVEAGLAAREPRDLTPLDVAVPREIGALVETINRFMARQARQFEIMRDLIADASHQLRTPVAAIRAQAELATEEPDPARQSALIARVHARAVGLSRLTDQLLNHALVIHRADTAPRDPLDLRAIAIRIVEETDTPEELRLDLAEDPLPCRGDALSLAEAGKNLVNNALSHGKAPVTIAARREGPRVVLAVRDRGPGMAEAPAAEGARFGQARGVTPASAGIGLSIVAAVAAAHEGALTFGRAPSGEFEAALAFPADPDAAE